MVRIMSETAETSEKSRENLNLDPGEYSLQFAAGPILDAIGGAPRIRDVCACYDLPVPSIYRVNMWRYRNSIPQNWLAVLLVAADRMGVDLDLRNYIIAVVHKPLYARLDDRMSTIEPRIFR